VDIFFIVGYPFFWFLILLAISATLLRLKIKKIGGMSLLLSLIVGFGMTPIGSEFFLDSISDVFVSSDMMCDALSPPESAIFLPGGLTSIGPIVKMTRWTSSRVHWINKYQKSFKLTELIIPGGDLYKDKKEGPYIKEQLNTESFKKVSIKTGSGSYSTYSNFLEIQNLNENKMYGLITSKWHGYRALKVARKQGFNACLLASISNKDTLELKEYPWAFKAALREYLAIAWYKLKGRI
jgi:vancomycin permeability regulator SanA